MCGIAGWIDWERDLRREESLLQAMRETLACRGPDAEGAWLSERAGLVHRRLIVVDPEGGAQPMVRRFGDRTYALVYNGELYNTTELRRELEARGFVFRTRSDTEALLLAYVAWGPDCVDKLNGIYAFAIWDDARRTLFLVRDRMGAKPLFYAERGSAFLFGSELKALLAHPFVEAEIGLEGIGEIFGVGPARTPGCGVFKDVHEVKPGYALTVTENGVKARRYWALASRPHEDDAETTAATVRWLLEDSVERQLVSDVPLCAFLSGGLDSSALVAFASKAFREVGRGPLHTFSIDFAGNETHFRPSAYQPNADAPWVKEVSRSFGTRHRELKLTTSMLVETIQSAVRARDLPGQADIDWSLFVACREIKKEFTVAISGECADEVFGGYPWFHREEDLSADRFPWAKGGDLRRRILAPPLAAAVDPEEYAGARYRESLAEVPRLEGEPPREARIREIAYLNLTWFMVTLLNRKDRMSMASGLEVRVPFADHRLVEYVWNIPWSIKTYGGREKGILRHALRGVLPSGVIERKKSPYPKTHNPEYLEIMRSMLRAILDDPRSPLLDLIDVEAVRRMTEGDSDRFDRPWYGQLMTGAQLFAYLVEVNTWLEMYRVRLSL